MALRLNPKLTRRSHAPLPDFASESTGSHSSRTDDTNSETGTSRSEEDSVIPVRQNNPRIHLLHNGKWIKKEYEVGRPVPRTGVWDCCGHTEHYSMYCDSLEARDQYKERIKAEDQAVVDEAERTSKRRTQLMDHIKHAQEHPQSIPFEMPLTTEEQAIHDACSSEGSFNAPMMISWLLRHYQEEPTTESGLKFALRHLETGEGCFLLHRHGLVNAVLKIFQFYKTETTIHLLAAQVLKQLLECNYTRSLIIKSVEPLHTAFGVARRNINSLDHVQAAAACVVQYTRSELGRSEIFKLHIIPHFVHIIRNFSRSVDLIRSVMKMINWATSDVRRMDYIFQHKCIHASLQCLKRHMKEGSIISPILFLLSRVAAQHPLSLELLLKKKAAVLVVQALQNIHNNDALQLQGLRLLQIISKTSEGWKQIDAIRGGWQSICQGTIQGDALVHKLPGEFQNPGWAIGDTPYLPLLDRMKLAAAKQAQNDIAPEPKAAWTVHSLREFMGLSMAGQTLAINVEYHEVYFELCSTLDILPHSGEEKETWFKRVRDFEAENEIKIEEMVDTVIEMRRRDALHKKMEAQNLALNKYSDEVMGTVKEVYVKGERITGEILETNDVDVGEALDGVV